MAAENNLEMSTTSRDQIPEDFATATTVNPGMPMPSKVVTEQYQLNTERAFTMHNPTFNPYPQPPPPYTMGFERPPSTLVGVNSAIQQNGRHPLSVVCPSCRNPVLTQTTQVVSPVLARNPRRGYYAFTGTLFFIIVFLIVIRFITGSYIPIFTIPLFALLCLLGLASMRYRQQTAAVVYSDVHHSCPVCKASLGVSNGQVYHMHSPGIHVHTAPQRY